RNYDPSKLVIYALEGSGVEIPVGFNYSIVDNANFASSPATYMIMTESALPVELLYIRSEVIDCTVNIYWATASELNNSHFEIYRSIDFNNWVFIEKLNGHGTTSNPNYYSLLDHIDHSNLYYYKVIQVDYDGQQKEFPIL